MTAQLSRRALLSATAALAATGAHAQLAGFTLSKPAVKPGRSTVRGKTIAWRAEAGETLMRNAAGTPRATIFSVAYLAEGADAATRPVTFLFNGGPGSSTRGLREGLAPRITLAAKVAPGFAFADNADSLIDASDLVFVDPPGTGFSRFVSPEAKAEYWGIEQDGQAIAAFVAGWLQAHGRLASPKFMIGQSYSGARTGQVARALAEWPGGAIGFNGVVVVSPGLGTGNQNPMAGQADRPSLTLPSEAAVARFHGKGAYTAQPVEAVAEAARQFANGPYATALAKGPALTPAERADMARQVAGFIGLSPETVAAADLFVPIPQFMDALLPDERLDLNDGRVGTRKGRAGRESSLDANAYDVDAAVAAFYRDEIGYAAPIAYVLSSEEANRTWNNRITRRPDHVPAIFKAMMAADPRLHILLTAGCYDLNVPYNLSLTRYLAQDLPAARFGHRLYPTGHPVYNDAATRPRSTDDLRAFYRQALT